MTTKRISLKREQGLLAMLGLYNHANFDGIIGPKHKEAREEFYRREGFDLSENQAPLVDKVDNMIDVQFVPYDIAELFSEYPRLNSWQPWVRERFSDFAVNNLYPALVNLSKEMYLSRRAQHVYAMATIEWETAGSFMPVAEAYYMKEDARQRYFEDLARKGRDYGVPDKYGRAYFGRGLTQLSLLPNYQRYKRLFDAAYNDTRPFPIDIVEHPDSLCDQDEINVSAVLGLFIMMHGMKTGSFTGREIGRYINSEQEDFLNARRVINGMDRAKEIADLAFKWGKKV